MLSRKRKINQPPEALVESKGVLGSSVGQADAYLDEYVSLAEASSLCSYTQEYLSLLARKGLINATKTGLKTGVNKPGRNWVITRKALFEYVQIHSADKKGNFKGELNPAEQVKAAIQKNVLTASLSDLVKSFKPKESVELISLKIGQAKKIFSGAVNLNSSLAGTARFLKNLRSPLFWKKAAVATTAVAVGILSIAVSPVAAHYYKKDLTTIGQLVDAAIGKSVRAAQQSFVKTAEVYGDTWAFVKNPQIKDVKIAADYLGKGFAGLGRDILAGSLMLADNFSEKYLAGSLKTLEPLVNQTGEWSNNLLTEPRELGELILTLSADGQSNQLSRQLVNRLKAGSTKSAGKFFSSLGSTYFELATRSKLLVKNKLEPIAQSIAGGVDEKIASLKSRQAFEPKVAGVSEEAEISLAQTNSSFDNLSVFSQDRGKISGLAVLAGKSFIGDLKNLKDLLWQSGRWLKVVPSGKLGAAVKSLSGRSGLVDDVLTRAGEGFKVLANLSFNKFSSQLASLTKTSRLAYENVFTDRTEIITTKKLITLEETRKLLGQLEDKIQYVTTSDGKVVGIIGSASSASSAGPVGPVGVMGIQGPAGPRGEAGPAGPAGIQGPAGPRGEAGPAGLGSGGDTYNYGQTIVYGGNTVVQSLSAVDTLSVGGGLGVGGELTVNGKVVLGDNFDKDTLTVTASTSLQGNLTVVGNHPTSLGGTLAVAGNTTLSGDVSILGSLTVGGSQFGATTTLTATGTNTILTVRQGGTGDLFNLYDGATEVFTVLDGGNVGVGTSTPAANLAIQSRQGQTQDLFRIGTSSNTTLTTTTDASFFRVAAGGDTTIKGKALNPTILSEERDATLLNVPRFVFVSGNYAYMAISDRASLAVIDISNPADPVFIAEERGPDPGHSLECAFSVFVSGRYAYVPTCVRDSLAVIDISNPADPVFIAEERGPTPNTSLDNAYYIAVQGNYAYVTSYSRGSLAVIDISNPADPVWMAEERGPNPNDANNPSLAGATGIVVSGKYAYITNQLRESIAVIDISNPADPVFVAEEQGPIPGTSLSGANHIAVAGKYAYITTDSGVLAIVNISNPADPVYVGEESVLIDYGRSPFVSGNYLYVADGNRLTVLDISNPADPVAVTAGYGTSGIPLSGIRNIFVSGNYVYLANYGRNSLVVMDISGLTVNNAQIGTLKVSNLSVDSFAQFNQGALIQGGLNVGAGAMFGGPVAINVSTSTSVGVSALQVTATSSAALVQLTQRGTGNILSLYASSTLALSVRGTGQTILSAIPATTKPSLLIQPSGTSSFNTATSSMLTVNAASTFTGDLLSLQLNGSVKFRIDYQGNAQYYSSSVYAGDVDPATDNSYDIGDLATTKRWRDVSLYRNLNVGAINTSDKLVRLSSTTIAVYNTDLTIQTNNSQDILLNPSGNRVGIGTSTPAATLAIQSTQGQTQDLFRIGTSSNTILTTTTDASFFKVAAGGNTTIKGRVINPVLVANLSNAALNGVRSVSVSGHYAYVANYSMRTLDIIDIANPAAPTLVTALSLGGSSRPYKAIISGNYVYVADGNNDALVIIDIANPNSPSIVSTISGPTPGTSLNTASSVFVSGNYAYVTTETNNSLAIIDISNPYSPTWVAETQGLVANTSLAGADGVFVSGKYAYIANQTRASLAIIDVSNPYSPTWVAETQGPVAGSSLGGAYEVSVVGKYAYVAAYGGALAIIDISNPYSPTWVAEERGPIPGTSLANAFHLFISGNYAYITSQSRGSLAVIDISSSTKPVFISETRGLVGPRGVFVAGNYAYVADRSGAAFAVFDVSGLTVSNAEIGTLKVSNLSVDAYAQFAQGAYIQGGLNVGQESMFGGSVAINVSTSTSVGVSALTVNAISSADLIAFSQQGTGKILGAYDGVSTNNANLAFGVYDGGYTVMNSTSTATALSIRQASTGDILNVFDGANEVLTVLDGGLVGIGTTTPASRLSVSTLAQAAANTKLFTVASTTGASLFQVNASGKVGIGTNDPLLYLHVKSKDGRGTALFGNDYSVNGTVGNRFIATAGSANYQPTLISVGGVPDGVVDIKSLGSYGEYGIVGAATNGMGSDTAVGGYFSSSFPLSGASNGNDANYGSYNLARVSSNAYTLSGTEIATLIGAYNTADLTNTTITTSGAVNIYGSQNVAVGVAGSTAIGGYFTASGGTNNYAAIFNAGKVGIGTTTPAARLQTTADTEQFRIAYSTDPTKYSSFTVNSSGNLNIASTGGFSGFGTTSPKSVLSVSTPAQQSSAYKLFTVASTTGATLFEVLASGATAVTNLGTGNSLTVNDSAGDATPFVVDASGNVGVGLTSPNLIAAGKALTISTTGLAGLELQATPAVASGQDIGNISYWNGTNRVAQIYVSATASNGADLHIYTKQTGSSITERFTILSTGLTGIGITTPVGQLSASSTNSIVAVFDQRGTSDILQLRDAGSIVMKVIDGGLVGIGTTTPTARLSVSSASQSSTPLFRVASTTNATYFQVASTGIVSVGTTTANQLSVAGNIQANSLLGNVAQSWGGAFEVAGTKDLLARFSLAKDDLITPTIIADLSKNGRKGTITPGASAGFSANQFGQSNMAYDFDGANTKIDTGSDWIGASAFSVSAWVYLDSYGEGGWGAAVVDNGKSALIIESDRIVFYGNGIGDQTADAYQLLVISTGAWHYIAVSKPTSAQSVIFYVDGTAYNPVGVYDQTGVTQAGTTNVIIGNNNAQSKTFDGRISDFRVYNKVLSASEVAALYNGSESTYSTRVGIGTTTPASVLSVTTALQQSASTKLLTVASTTGASLFQVLGSGRVSVGPTSTPGGLLAVENTGTSHSFIVSDQANDTTPFVINASGNVGIGTAAPASSLQVNGTVIIGSATGGNGTLKVGDGSTAKITLNGSAAATQWIEWGGGSNSRIAAAGSGADQADAYDFYTGNDQAFKITGVASTVNYLDLSSSATGNALTVTAAGTDTNIPIRLTPKGTGDVIFASSTGQFVGIGTTTPSAILAVHASAGNDSFIIGSTTATYFKVNKNGKVGIGLTSPSSYLHIQGTAEQLRLSYSSTAYWSNTVNASGTATVLATGTAPSLIWKVRETTALTVSDSQISANVPLQVANSGDVGVAGDIIMSNGTASYITGENPLTIRTYNPAQSVDLTLTAAGNGAVVVDDGLEIYGTTTIALTQFSANAVQIKDHFGTQLFNINNSSTSTLTTFTLGPNNGSTATATSIRIGYGGICVDNDGLCQASTTGRVSARSYVTGGSDVAENYPSVEALAPGDLVMADPNNAGYIIKTTGEYNNNVIGVISEEPGIVMGMEVAGYPVALVGRIPTKVTNVNGAILPGDLLTVAPIAGYAMKFNEGDSSKIIGTSLDSFSGAGTSTEGVISMFINADYKSGGFASTTFGLITDGQIATNAAISDLKLGTIRTAGKIALTALPVEIALLQGETQTFTGNYIFGQNADTSDLIVMNSRIGSSIKFAVDNLYNIGSASKSAANVYARQFNSSKIVIAADLTAQNMNLDNYGLYLSASSGLAYFGDNVVVGGSVEAIHESLLQVVSPTYPDFVMDGGDLLVNDDLGVGGDLYVIGGIRVSGAIEFAKEGIAQMMSVESGEVNPVSGDVIIVNASGTAQGIISNLANSSQILGVIGTSSGAVFAPEEGLAVSLGQGSTRLPVVFSGVTTVNVSAENGPIHKGDKLTTADSAGMAMLASRPGAGVLGLALEDFAEGEGQIRVLVDLGTYFAPTAKVITVSLSGADFKTITKALDSISDNSAQNRYLIKVGPGVYEEQITMKDYVDIAGEGGGLVTVKSEQSPVIIASAVARLEGVTVKSTSNGAEPVLVSISAGNPVLQDLNFEAATANQAVGVSITGSTSLTTGGEPVQVSLNKLNFDSNYSQAIVNLASTTVSIMHSDLSQINGTALAMQNGSVKSYYNNFNGVLGDLYLAAGSKMESVSDQYEQVSNAGVFLDSTNRGKVSDDYIDYGLLAQSSLSSGARRAEGEELITQNSQFLVDISAGEAYINGVRINTSEVDGLALTASSTNYVFLSDQGEIFAATTSALSFELSAILIAQVQTDNQEITEIINERSNQVTVAKQGGQFRTIAGALDSIVSASADNHWTIKVEPGVYNEQVELKPYIDIIGSGKDNTTILGLNRPALFSAEQNATSTTDLGSSKVANLKLSLAGDTSGQAVVDIADLNLTLEDVNIVWSGNEGVNGTAVKVSGSGDVVINRLNTSGLSYGLVQEVLSDGSATSTVVISYSNVASYMADVKTVCVDAATGEACDDQTQITNHQSPITNIISSYNTLTGSGTNFEVAAGTIVSSAHDTYLKYQGEGEFRQNDYFRNNNNSAASLFNIQNAGFNLFNVTASGTIAINPQNTTGDSVIISSSTASSTLTVVNSGAGVALKVVGNIILTSATSGIPVVLSSAGAELNVGAPGDIINLNLEGVTYNFKENVRRNTLSAYLSAPVSGDRVWGDEANSWSPPENITILAAKAQYNCSADGYLAMVLKDKNGRNIADLGSVDCNGYGKVEQDDLSYRLTPEDGMYVDVVSSTEGITNVTVTIEFVYDNR